MEYRPNAYLRQVAELLESHPDMRLAEAEAEAGRLIALSSPIQEEHSPIPPSLEIANNFRIRSVLNPRYLSSKVGKHPYFFLIDSDRGHYPLLRDLAKNWHGDSSWYALFGAYDLLLFMFSSHEEAENVEAQLRERGFSPLITPVRRIVRWWQHTIGVIDDTIKYTEEDLLHMIEDHWSTDVDQKQREALIASGIVIGPALIEDFSKTRRVRAFVGIHTRQTRMPVRSEEILRYSSTQSVLRSSIRSLFECGQTYDVILELICNDLELLHQATEQLANLGRHGGFGSLLGTTTFVVAESHDNLPTPLSASLFEHSNTIGRVGSIRPIERKYIASLDQSMRRRYMTSISDATWLMLMESLTEMDSYRWESLDQDIRDKIQLSIRSFTSGVISESRAMIESAAISMFTAVESVTKQALKILLDVFYRGFYKPVQAKYKMPNANPNELVLADLCRTLQLLSEDRNYQIIGFLYPDEIDRLYRLFREFRNSLIHQDQSWRDSKDFPVMIREVRDALRQGALILQWLQDRIFGAKFPQLPTSIIAAIVQENMADEQMTSILPSEIGRVLRDETRQLELRLGSALSGMDRQLTEQIETGLSAVTAALVSGTASGREGRKLLAVAEDMNQRSIEILEHVSTADRSTVQKILESTGSAGQAVSLNLVASAIWAVLVKVDPEYLRTLLQQLFR